MHGFCFPYQAVFTSTPEFSDFCPPDSPPTPTGGGVSEQLHGASLLAGIKPQQLDVSYLSPFSVEEYQY